MREDVEQLRGEGPGPRPLGIHPDRPEGKVAVHLGDGAEFWDAPDQRPVRGVAQLLVPGAQEQAASLGELEQLPRLAGGLHERLLDVHMRPGDERFAGRLEMGASRRADVHELGLRLPQEVRERRVGRGACQRGELPRRAGGRVAHGCDDVGRPHTAQGLKMQASHSPRADEGDTDRRAGGGQRGHARGHRKTSARGNTRPRRVACGAHATGARRSLPLPRGTIFS